MTYQEWSEEYRQSAAALQEKLTGLKLQYRTAPPDKLQELRFRIATLYSMYLDCAATARLLAARKGEIG